MKYDLHLVFNEKLLFEVRNISDGLKVKSTSATIVAIFEILLPRLEKYQIEFQNRKSKYKIIADKKEKRHHFHIYFPDRIYRKLKELHQYLNFYSMAQIVREMLQLYIKECKKKGNTEAVKYYSKIKNKWNRLKNKIIGKNITRQTLRKSIPNLSINVTYDINFHPYIIKYLS